MLVYHEYCDDTNEIIVSLSKMNELLLDHFDKFYVFYVMLES